MPTIITATEYLEIASIPLATPAWRIIDLSALWDEGDVKGSDYNIPHAHGSLPTARHRAATKYALPMHIFGDHDMTGTPYANPRNGLYTNFAYLRDNIAAPVTTGDGTRAATLHLPSGSTLTAAITPLGNMRMTSKAALGAAVLQFSIAAGRFA